MSFGRPSKYKPEYCEKVISLMEEGASMIEVAYELRVHIDTLYEWQKVHPDFSDAIKKAQHFSEGWWTREGRLNLKTKDFNSGLWFMNMKNRFKWRNEHNEDKEDQKSVMQNAIDKLAQSDT